MAEVAAIYVDVIIFKNRYNSLKFTIDGVANLNGWTARWTLAANRGAAALIDKSTSDDIDIPTDGVDVFVDVWPANSSAIDQGTSFYHELTLIDSESNPRVAAYGDACEVRDVTDIS